MAREIGVVGAGGWGTALAKVLADKGERVTLWCHGSASFNELVENRQNRTYLPGISLPDNVVATQNLQHAVAGKALVICAVPFIDRLATSYTVAGPAVPPWLGQESTAASATFSTTSGLTSAGGAKLRSTESSPLSH